MTDMTPRILIGLICIICLSFVIACSGKPPAKQDDEQNPNVKGDMALRVQNWVKNMSNPDSYPRQRRTSAIQAGMAATNPRLTPEMRTQLIEALNKMIENEPMSKADEQTKQSIIEEGQKALNALK